MVSTPPKNISQLGLLFPIHGKNVPNHQPVLSNQRVPQIEQEEVTSQKKCDGRHQPDRAEKKAWVLGCQAKVP